MELKTDKDRDLQKFYNAVGKAITKHLKVLNIDSGNRNISRNRKAKRRHNTILHHHTRRKKETAYESKIDIQTIL